MNSDLKPRSNGFVFGEYQLHISVQESVILTEKRSHFPVVSAAIFLDGSSKLGLSRKSKHMDGFR
jgi:hypothetical protein